MDATVIEWCFDCDQASEAANDVFDTVMNRDWLLQHGIHPFDTDDAWKEAVKQLSELKEPCVLTVTRAAEPSLKWELFQATLMKGGTE